MRRILIMVARIAGPILLSKLLRGRKRKRVEPPAPQPQVPHDQGNHPQIENQIDG